MADALLAAAVALGGITLGALLGYRFRRREHLRELQIERYVDFQGAANMVAWAWNRAMEGDPTDSANFVQLANAQAALLDQSTRVRYVASTSMDARIRAVMEVAEELDVCAQRTFNGADIPTENLSDLNARAAVAWNQMAAQGRRELWGRRMPSVDDDAEALRAGVGVWAIDSRASRARRRR